MFVFVVGVVATPRRRGRGRALPTLQVEQVHGRTFKSCVALERERRGILEAMMVVEERSNEASEGRMLFRIAGWSKLHSAIFFSFT